MANHSPKNKKRLSLKRVLTLIFLALIFGCVGTIAIVEIYPSFGAQVANQLRNWFGPRTVAQLETVVFQVQDTVKQWQYASGLEQPEAPWQTTPSPTSPLPLFTPSPTPSPSLLFTSTPPPPNSPSPSPSLLFTPSPLPSNTPTFTPSPTPWHPTNLTPFGTLEGEGIWQPYLFDANGQMVAARTFLQPDPARPYTIVAVVAMDLARADLHFVLGFSDPALVDGPTGDGLIPDADRGALLAAFNGGFRTANGLFGAMANGVVALPPVEGLATVGIYQDGSVQIGNWGTDIVDSPDLIAWRQNCPLVIQNGQVGPKVNNGSTYDWGGTISNEIVTRRSGMGLSMDGTLYYFAGPSLSMPALADAMLAAGVENGMLLDINHFWVHFTAIYPDETGELLAEALLPEEMIDQVDRYLKASPVDFFYVTVEEE
ncbi:MAG: phosphodiester glycosidase family protein [Anaerolineales bacterium]|nr:phosphodiester glycosidase family protein [Anaerolineales bacterium]